jgi:hypothetical protein
MHGRSHLPRAAERLFTFLSFRTASAVRNLLSYPTADSWHSKNDTLLGGSTSVELYFCGCPTLVAFFATGWELLRERSQLHHSTKRPPITLVIPNRVSGEESAFLSNSRFLAPLKTTNFWDVQPPWSFIFAVAPPSSRSLRQGGNCCAKDHTFTTPPNAPHHPCHSEPLRR